MDTIKNFKVCSTRELLDLIGWSPAVMAAHLNGINPRTCERWASARNETPENIHAWLVKLAWFHLTNPYPEGWSPNGGDTCQE